MAWIKFEKIDKFDIKLLKEYFCVRKIDNLALETAQIIQTS